MQKFVRVILASALLLAFPPGCAFWKMHKEKRRAAEQARLREKQTAPQLIGTVALVNEGDGFVLINNENLPSPPLGTVVKTRVAGLDSAELRLTEIRRRPFIIADIVKGAPKKGDQVFQVFQ
jgi:hypothetical protein